MRRSSYEQRQRARSPSHEVVDLRECPTRLDDVADRISAAFWTAQDRPWIVAGLREMIERQDAGADLRGCLVALGTDGGYLGSAVLIPDDGFGRPEWKPWLAALWVDEPHRRRGVATSLIAAVCSSASRAGLEEVYLGARRGLEPFYRRRGFVELERDVGPARNTLMRRLIVPER